MEKAADSSLRQGQQTPPQLGQKSLGSKNRPFHEQSCLQRVQLQLREQPSTSEIPNNLFFEGATQPNIHESQLGEAILNNFLPQRSMVPRQENHEDLEQNSRLQTEAGQERSYDDPTIVQELPFPPEQLQQPPSQSTGSTHYPRFSRSDFGLQVSSSQYEVDLAPQSRQQVKQSMNTPAGRSNLAEIPILQEVRPHQLEFFQQQSDLQNIQFCKLLGQVEDYKKSSSSQSLQSEFYEFGALNCNEDNNNDLNSGKDVTQMVEQDSSISNSQHFPTGNQGLTSAQNVLEPARDRNLIMLAQSVPAISQGQPLIEFGTSEFEVLDISAENSQVSTDESNWEVVQEEHEDQNTGRRTRRFMNDQPPQIIQTH